MGSFPPRIKYGVNSSGNPGVVPAKAGNQARIRLDSSGAGLVHWFINTITYAAEKRFFVASLLRMTQQAVVTLKG